MKKSLPLILCLISLCLAVSCSKHRPYEDITLNSVQCQASELHIALGMTKEEVASYLSSFLVFPDVPYSSDTTYPDEIFIDDGIQDTVQLISPQSLHAWRICNGFDGDTFIDKVETYFGTSQDSDQYDSYLDADLTPVTTRQDAAYVCGFSPSFGEIDGFYVAVLI